MQYMLSICDFMFRKSVSLYRFNGRSSITSCAYRHFISCNIIVDFWYCLACCILYSTKSKEISMKRSASAHISLKYRQRIFYSLLVWFGFFRINVDLAIFQPYLDLEAGDNQSLKIQVARPEIEPRFSCSASQELNHSATAAPLFTVEGILFSEQF